MKSLSKKTTKQRSYILATQPKGLTRSGVMKTDTKSMKKLANVYVESLKGYRKETAILVKKLLEGVHLNEVEVSYLHEKLDNKVEDIHRLADAKKMVRVMAVTLNESPEMRQKREVIRNKDRKPLEEVVKSLNTKTK